MAVKDIKSLREELIKGQFTKEAKELGWIKIFGDKKIFRDSIMSPKPKISNDWTIENYLAYHKDYGITKLRNLDEWAHHEDAYAHYLTKLRYGNNSADQSDTPDEDQFGLINYVDFCNDICQLSIEIKDDLKAYGVSEIQAYVGAYTTMYFVLKRFRRQFYTTLYTFEKDEANAAYQKSPLRHLLLFMLERRLTRLIPHSDTFKFGKTYFETFDYRKEVGEAIYNHLVENYTSDMVACKFLF